MVDLLIELTPTVIVSLLLFAFIDASKTGKQP